MNKLRKNTEFTFDESVKPKESMFWREVSLKTQWVLPIIGSILLSLSAVLVLPEEKLLYGLLPIVIFAVLFLAVTLRTIWFVLVLIVGGAVYGFLYQENHSEIIPEKETIDVGDTVCFGSFWVDGQTKGDIVWVVLDKQDSQMLLISKYALESRQYHSCNKAVLWADSDLRGWLNGAFLEEAFTWEERERIRSVTTEPGINDQVFVLSKAELEQYFKNDKERICRATPYAVSRGAYVRPDTDGSWWFLRSPGSEPICVMSVNSDGTIDDKGGKVASERGTVRPAIWVKY